MTVSVRLKLLLLVATATLCLCVVLGIDAWSAREEQVQIEQIQASYLPLLELGPVVRAHFASMTRAFQDAAAAASDARLENASQARDSLLQALRQAGHVLPREELPALRIRIDTYYRAAESVTKRLITNETGVDLVAGMETMQAAQREADEAIARVVTFDREKLTLAFAELRSAQEQAATLRIVVTLACLLIVVTLSTWLRKHMLRALDHLEMGLARFGSGDLTTPITIVTDDEIGVVARRANEMAAALAALGSERARRASLAATQLELSRLIQGELEPTELAERVLGFVAELAGAPVAAFYALDPAHGDYALRAAHGLSLGVHRYERVVAGDGLIGLVAEQRAPALLEGLPEPFFRICLASGEMWPTAVWLVPIIHLEETLAVVELGLSKPPDEDLLEELRSVQESIAVALHTCNARKANADLLQETQQQAARLAAQEEELRQINEELTSQQEELRITNGELVRQAQELAQRNDEVEHARGRLEEQARRLEAMGRYKSEFLANMSHELRTPLNSMLLLSEILSRNETGNLEDKQVEFASTIHAAGQDLLRLINQVLDLAKIEAGKLTAAPAPMSLREVLAHLTRVYSPLAAHKGLTFGLHVAPDIPDEIVSDRTHIEQILTNLIGNAIKFTERGSVTLEVVRPENATLPEVPASETLVIRVQDTGVGIDGADRSRIFEAFEQVDSGAQRRHGGTGLGLAIARNLVQLLGGQLSLQSERNVGTTFEVHLPQRLAPANPPPSPRSDSPPPGSARGPSAARVTEPRRGPGWPEREIGTLLIVEDDLTFAERIGELANEQGLRTVFARDGASGLRLARVHRPNGIVLDLRLPDMDGLEVIDQLRLDPSTKQIPVHIVSCMEDDGRGIERGAIGYLRKPTTRGDLLRVVRSLAASTGTIRVLIVEDDAKLSGSLADLVGEQGVLADCAASGTEALDKLRTEAFDAVILDLGLPDIDGLAVLQRMDQDESLRRLPVIIHTGRALSKAETAQLEAYTESIVLKGSGSVDRVLEELRLFLGEVGRDPVRSLSPSTKGLEGKKLLIADDDMRTAYAISALARARGMEVVVADTGHMALNVLRAQPDFDAVIMDIMMPEMDGYEATRQIRKDPRFADLPIIALTAKAMKHDRVCCIEAGASDYLPKPVNGERLLSLLHAWLSGPG